MKVTNVQVDLSHADIEALAHMVSEAGTLKGQWPPGYPTREAFEDLHTRATDVVRRIKKAKCHARK